MSAVRAIGASTLDLLQSAGRLAIFAVQGVAAMFAPPFFGRQLFRQFYSIGFYSLPVVGLTAVFTGAALALNIYTGGARFNAEQIMPQIVALGITRELGPVLAALMLAGRVSAAIAAEIGAMRATEQIDALQTLSTDPYRYLIAPRLTAGIVTMPLLTLAGDIIGVAGGWLVAVATLRFNSDLYIRNTWSFLQSWDVISGLIKGCVFGFIIALMGCYHGFNSSGGARGVGRSTTNAVVSAAILVFACDYVLTSFMR
ncbi:ABC transporter permease [Caulobacter sp. S45]|jgi:phospholipid/cholesterol/gamma-HCH transport system permease protein|uniref:MlaE family ABC transporter permease n=1 Tax=Caulobacter sp. S45 TaxID=1641861 RepID=UPI00131CBB07|nr:ABC transporter permease [Caulobacter sp. S45]